MLKRLSYSVQFPSTGRTFENQIVFEPGLTAVVGPNEAGKSLIIEMIGYAWFGKAALRGAAGDYKNLSVELEQVVHGKLIRIVRQPKYERIWVDDVEQAVGAEAVNKFTPIFLGFGLDVFNIALVAQQDELHALTKMKPTERGKMIERLSGMDSLEKSERDCKDQAKTHNQNAEAMAMMIRTPVEPDKPSTYHDVNELRADLNAMTQRNDQRKALARVALPQAPIEPAPLDVKESEAELQEYQTNRGRLENAQRSIEREISRIPLPSVDLDTLKAAEAYAEYRQEAKRRGPEPEYDLERLHQWEHYFDAGQAVECPICHHKFGIRSTEIDLSRIPVPVIDSGHVREQIKRHERWADPLPVPAQVVVINPEKEKLAHARSEELVSLRHQLSEITVPVDRTHDLERVRDYNREWARYDERSKRYQHDVSTWQEAQASLQTLGEVEDEEFAREAWMSAANYDRDMATYTKEATTYVEQLQLITTEREAADGFKRGADALKLTRQQAKQELTPSLSREASKLLVTMTNGARKSIIVDEDFNVFVDNQPLATLSGSGKSVVNLALRIGLGRVLTSKVMSIFIGDEVDYAMDAERVEATQATFRNLTSILSQVILVTHKGVDADHIVSLK